MENPCFYKEPSFDSRFSGKRIVLEQFPMETKRNCLPLSAKNTAWGCHTGFPR
jgi:hypothetical protein